MTTLTKATTYSVNIELATRLITMARAEWLQENDPQDGTDVVTPYDEWFYRDRTEKAP